MKKLIGFFLMIGFVASYSCSDKADEIEIYEPTVTDLQHHDLTSSSATLCATVSDNSGPSSITRGFRLSKENTTAPSTAWGVDYCCGNGSGGFSKIIEGLEENTTYYYLAYAYNSKGYGFSEISYFRTPKEKAANPQGAPIVLKAPELLSVDYSATGFEASDGTKYNYKMSYLVIVDICDHKSILRGGFEIGGQIWYWDDLTENEVLSTLMTTISNSSTISSTITAYALMNDGTVYTGNSVTVSGTYTGNNGGGSGDDTPKSKFAEDTFAKTVYKNRDSLIAFESLARSLNRYGITIYKEGNSYYWKDFDGRKHPVSPNSYYSNKIYAYDYMMGDKSNNYKLREAWVYVSFSFKPF